MSLSSCNCFRVGIAQWISEERFAGLLEVLDRFPGAAGELTFFTSETHPPIPLKVMAERTALLERRLDQARQRGWNAGINLLSTIGHHEENLPGSLTGEYTWMTDPDGRISRGVLCPNHERSRDYIRRVWELVTRARPDYLWIDDDVRLLGHLPIRVGCFCPTCLNLFNAAAGVTWTRESLRTAVNHGPAEERLALRRAWLTHNRSTLARLFALIEETVHGLKPGLPLGFMTGERYYEGYDFDGWAEVLAGPGRAPVRWRPGGGTYTDERLDSIVGKAHEIGRQVAFLPPAVTVVQSEIESFPYQRLKKSAHATALEAAAYIAAGCTGAAYNVLSMYAEPLAEYEPLLARLAAARPFLDLLAGHCGRLPPIGIHSGWHKDSQAVVHLDDGDWLAPGQAVPGASQTSELHEIGLPPAYALAGARVVALTGAAIRAFDAASLRRVLSGGVYLDATAAGELQALGYGELVGFSVGDGFPRDALEQLLPHPLNGPYAGRERDCRQSFWPHVAHGLIPAPGAEPLARMVDYGRQLLAGCTLGVFENNLGGRVCVAGYAPWTFLQNLSASARLKAIGRWLSRDTLPAYVASYHRAVIWVRESDGPVIALLNASLDPARELILAARTDRGQLSCVDQTCRETPVPGLGEDGPYRLFRLPEVGPWEMVLLTA